MKLGYGKPKTVNSLEEAVRLVIQEQWGSVHMRSARRAYQVQVSFESGRSILGVMVRIILESHFGQGLLVKLRQDFGYTNDNSMRRTDYLQLTEVFATHALLYSSDFSTRFCNRFAELQGPVGILIDSVILDAGKTPTQTIQEYKDAGLYTPITPT